MFRIALFGYFYINIKVVFVKSLLIGFLYLLACPQYSYAQKKPELKIKYFSKEEGLLNLNIKHVAQDSIGFIWIATNNGLFKYDGYNFRSYYSNQNDSATLLNNEIFYLYIDSKANLWVGTKSGLNRYNIELDNFERCNDLDRFRDVVDKYIIQIVEDRNGTLLVSSQNYIFKYNETDQKFTPVLSIESGKINHFEVDENNKLWLSGTSFTGLKKYDLNTKKWEQPSVTGNDNLFNTNISHFSLNNDTLWIATRGEGIKMLDISSTQVTSFPVKGGDGATAIYTYIDNKQNIWTIDYTGLKFFDKQKSTFIDYYPKTLRPNVTGIFQDKQGNYWVYHGSNGIGLSMALKGFGYFNKDYSDFWHTSGDNITALCEDSEGNLWSGNSKGGISVFKYKQHKISVFNHNKKDKYSIGKGEIECLFRDSRGIIWVSSYFGGLQYFDKKKKRFIGYKHDPDDPTSISGTDIRSIVEDAEGNLWLAVHGKGVDKFNREQGTFTHYNKSGNKLSNDWTFDLLIDHKGDLWVASSYGLNHLKKGETLFTNYLLNPDDTSSLPNNYINTIYEDDNSIIWIGTTTGLCRYNRAKDNFIRYVNIFNDENISGILSDRDNNLWLSTLAGLAMFDYKTEQVKNFGISDGLISDEFNPRSCYKTALNELFFGGTKGIVRFKPHELTFNTIAPYVFIDKIKILNQEITINDASDYHLNKQINQAKSITLKHTDKIITIDFKALSFINPQSNQYAYMLEGFDDIWHYSGTIRSATYTNLDPGTYTFRVKASNNDGYWNEKGASIEIIVLPPWWATWWFRSIAIVVILGLFYALHRIRVSFYRKQQKTLNKLVKERTLDLEESAAKLEERQEEINQQNEVLEHQKDELVVQHKKLKIRNKSIRNSIEYAKRIQDAALQTTMELPFKEHFIFFKPKDIVSGDFYFTKKFFNYTVIAASDCTGHGVPGAFMSLLGISMLNEITYKHYRKISRTNFEPAQILEDLRSNVIKTLKQKQDTGSPKDGMDIALCIYDEETKELQYSGAYHPLILVRDNNFSEVKGDKMPIGIHMFKKTKTKPFTNHKIQLQDGDCIYLFSDGYQDQFGEKANRKFLKRYFYRLLSEIHDYPMDEQKQMLEIIIKEFRGAVRQTDDVLVIGMRV